jgi:DNA-binding transcriptional LysR family regulator
LFDDLHALVQFAQAGSIAGAADRLYRTPSAITRQLQRLEAALGAELLDRSVRPPRLNSLGSRVLEQARDLWRRAEALTSLASSDAEPYGLLRVGLAHPLAEGTFVEPIRALTKQYPRVRLLLLSERTNELFDRLLAGDLDVAAVPLPKGRTAPPPLLTNIIATNRVEIVQGAAGKVDGDWKSLGRAPWVLNPPGCFLRIPFRRHPWAIPCFFGTRRRPFPCRAERSHQPRRKGAADPVGPIQLNKSGI